MGKLDGGVVAITGAGSGIGRACALRIAREGAAVALCDLDAEALERVVGEIEASGGRATAQPCDVRGEADVEAFVERSVEELGELSALVTCAGILSIEQTHECLIENWQRVIDVNLTGTFLACKHALVSMLRRGGGSIVTIGSTSSLVAGHTDVGPGYKASKGGVLQLTRLIAAQYGKEGIRANCLCPGPINTNIVETGEGSEDEVEEFARLARSVPLGRGGEPEEVASVAAFLASADSSYMTGSAVLADGGFTAL